MSRRYASAAVLAAGLPVRFDDVMQMFVAVIEVACQELDRGMAERVAEQLAKNCPATALSSRGWLEVTISLPAVDLAQAAVVACMLVEAATGKIAVACAVMTEQEREGRERLFYVGASVADSPSEHQPGD